MDRLTQIMVEHTRLAREASRRDLSLEEKYKILEQVKALRKERNRLINICEAAM